jgi:hypothetical protein
MAFNMTFLGRLRHKIEKIRSKSVYATTFNKNYFYRQIFTET